MNNVSGSNTTWESPPDMTAEYSQPSDGDSGKRVGRIAGLVTGIMVILLFVCVCLDRRRNRKKRHVASLQQQPHDGRQHIRQPAISNPPMDESSTATPGVESSMTRTLIFSYEDLERATEKFSTTNLLGEGGYGPVYKGVLADGKMVAIKKLRLDSNQGEGEFRAEVEIISWVCHKNLVSLVGYCFSEEHKILVYEFVPNGTLHLHLHGNEKPTLDWPTRMNIALGSANGLAYLHEECKTQIIHRDIKTSNILLDDKFVVKVADFGLAKFLPDSKSHVSTGVKGTFGYLDPAYALSGQLTDKADIFSFGVVLLELITGRVPTGETKHLYLWAKPLAEEALENGKFDDLIDPKLQNQDIPRDEIHRMVGCAVACVCRSASNRPKMSKIVRALEGNLPLEDLYGGIKPGDSEVDLKKHENFLQEDYKEDTNEQSQPSTNFVSALQSTAR